MHKTQAINRLLVDTMSLYFVFIVFLFGVASLNKMFIKMTTFIMNYYEINNSLLIIYYEHTCQPQVEVAERRHLEFRSRKCPCD